MLARWCVNYFYVSLKWVFLSFLLVQLVGCGDKSTDPFVGMNFDPYGVGFVERVKAYHEESGKQELVNHPARDERVSLYLDFSSGINKAFADPSIAKLMSITFNSVMSKDFDVYKMGSKKIVPMEVSDLTQLGEKIANPSEYLDIYAPIQQTVEQIVDSRHDVLLITDYEEWQGGKEVANTAFLKIPFTKWLSEGNSIHFFVGDYLENNLLKHLYFTVFTYGEINENSLITRLEPVLSQLNRYDLSQPNIKVKNRYGIANLGGVFNDAAGKTDREKNILDVKEGYFNGITEGKSFEIYPLGLDWKTIDETISAYKEQNLFNDFFRGIFVDFGREDAFIFNKISLEVYDVSADFERYARSVEALKHKPKLEKGVNGEDKFSDSEKDLIALACYDTKGQVSNKDCIYEKQAPVAVNEMFAVNDQLFKNTRETDHSKVELGVTFHPLYKMEVIKNPDALKRIDLVLDAPDVNLNSHELDLFKWRNAKGVPNLALYESIRAVIQEPEVRPAKKLIYTYYVKTLQ
jgi:hypothetical protein